MNYKINYTKLLVVKTSGRMNAEDFIKMAEDLLRHPYFSQNCNVVFDHTALEFNKVSFDDLQKIRTFHKKNEEKIGNGKSAIVVNVGLSDGWHKLWSQGDKIKTGNITKVFENYDNAISWITKDDI
ncbi:hypothetical protein ACFL2G_00250 [Candidatus Omnitrophota bacterium]